MMENTVAVVFILCYAIIFAFGIWTVIDFIKMMRDGKRAAVPVFTIRADSEMGLHFMLAIEQHISGFPASEQVAFSRKMLEFDEYIRRTKFQGTTRA